MSPRGWKECRPYGPDRAIRLTLVLSYSSVITFWSGHFRQSGYIYQQSLWISLRIGLINSVPIQLADYSWGQRRSLVFRSVILAICADYGQGGPPRRLAGCDQKRISRLLMKRRVRGIDGEPLRPACHYPEPGTPTGERRSGPSPGSPAHEARCSGACAAASDSNLRLAIRSAQALAVSAK